jgi:dephospho-CoA kinase
MIICLAGPRASGKSTTAKWLASLLGWRSFSFGDYVREVVRERGLDPQDLLVLQNTGTELIEKGWDNFCQNLLTYYGYNNENAVIDGIRHVQAVITLASITHSRVILVYLDVPETVQHERMQHRNRGEYEGNENHDVEKKVKCEVREKADFIINAEIPAEEIAQSIIKALSF